MQNSNNSGFRSRGGANSGSASGKIDFDALIEEFGAESQEEFDAYQSLTIPQQPAQNGYHGQTPATQQSAQGGYHGQTPATQQSAQSGYPRQTPATQQPAQGGYPRQMSATQQPAQGGYHGQNGYPQQMPATQQFQQNAYPQQRSAYPQQQGAMGQPQQQNQNTRANGYYFDFGEPDASGSVNPTLADKKTGKPTAAAPTPKKRISAEPVSFGRALRDSIIVIGMLIIFSACAMVVFASGLKMAVEPVEQKSFFEDMGAEIRSFKSDSVSAIFEIPKVYILPWGEQPAPVPNAECYGSKTLENGTKVLTYEDPTITVNYWVERHYNSDCHYAEIWIAHPTQLRTAYAGGVFGTTVKYTPQTIAKQVNAVIAINADYCGYRSGGIIVRQNTVYRNTARGWDILLIDSEGDFHIMSDKKVKSSEVMKKYEIVNTVEFGPSLVVDGQIELINVESGCGYNWNENRESPRTAIGQIGKLHYLFCCVEGRSEQDAGVLTSEMAQLMFDKNCTQAYNLDGGQSTTIIFGGEAMNTPLWGGQRVVTDIFYCATAIPNEGGAE